MVFLGALYFRLSGVLDGYEAELSNAQGVSMLLRARSYNIITVTRGLGDVLLWYSVSMVLLSSCGMVGLCKMNPQANQSTVKTSVPN